jgi:hypothetical protein
MSESVCIYACAFVLYAHAFGHLYVYALMRMCVYQNG